MSRMLAGAIGDGAFKVVLGAAFAVGSAWLNDLFGVPAWLVLIAGAALLIGGGIEVVYVRRRPMATCLRLMIGYDIGWAVASAVALVVAWQGGTAGGEIGVAYLVVAPLALAALLVGAAATDVRLPTADAQPPATDVHPTTTDVRPPATDVRPAAPDTSAA
ncbi:glycoside hydrolase family protein [Streptomyces sp. CBMAI 2042]|uniref:hypothetical protein n=1 Tax=Streptomyces sp. CBMAI 2042 TaxID=2305222 RepID=UPI000F276B23|nr:hypothetical protein [Streptomyces sp. CBMAI 2042]RLV66889.1 glycoside hydrolase family protein [Streptomyces sp. CBMAI 2042]